MNPIQQLLTLLCLAASWSAPVAARPLSLEEALHLAEAHSPALSAALAQEQGAQAAVESAAAYPNPELEVAAGHFRPRQAGGETGGSQALSLAQPIEWPALREARRHGAQAGVRASAAALQQARLELRARIKQAFYDNLRRAEELQVAQENRELLEQIRNRVKLKVEVGESPRYELVKAEAEALTAANAAKSAQLRLTQARAALRALLGVTLPDDIEPLPGASLAPEPPPLEALRAEMLAQHPLLKTAQAEIARAEARVEAERSLRLPQPTVKLTSERDPESALWRVGVSLPLPLWNRREGSIGEALAGLRQAEAEHRRILAALGAELEQAHARYQIARSLVETFESALLKEAENALRVAEAAYRYGERGLLDYLDAQRTLRATRLDFLSARYELLAAQVEIERLRAIPLNGVHP